MASWLLLLLRRLRGIFGVPKILGPLFRTPMMKIRLHILRVRGHLFVAVTIYATRFRVVYGLGSGGLSQYIDTPDEP